MTYQRTDIQNILISLGIQLVDYCQVGGGSISRTYKISTEQGAFFLKLNKETFADNYKSEIDGLNRLRKSNCIKVPELYDSGLFDGKAYILMEYIESTVKSKDFYRLLGRQLAEMHSFPSLVYYGYHQDNYIGSLVQYNNSEDSWVNFFIKERFDRQLKLCKGVNRSFYQKFECLYQKLPDILIDYGPSLLHGDLWSGNVMSGTQNVPVLIDPAVYYGNREVDLGYTKLFGGFDSDFYESYNECFPLEDGLNERLEIYNLYPLLVHFNLFGAGYYTSIVDILGKYS